MTVSAAAEHLAWARNFIRVLNGKAQSRRDGMRLAAAFGTSTPEVWLRMQAKYDLWQLGKRSRIRVNPLPICNTPDTRELERSSTVCPSAYAPFSIRSVAASTLR